jgi:acyl dehydratase
VSLSVHLALSRVTEIVLRMSKFAVGQVHVQVVVENLTRTQIVQYAGASGDFNPLHTDELFATSVAGYSTTISHGMLTMGMTAHMLTDFVGDGQLVSFGGRFGGLVKPGDTLTARAEVVGFDHQEGQPVVMLSLSTTNSKEEEVFTGYAIARCAH